MTRKEIEDKIVGKLDDLTLEELKDLLKIVLTMSFKNEKGLKEYTHIIEDLDNKEARHIRDEFIDYQKRYLSD
ncbi:MAG: hypothetical protein WBB45_09830 [Cyclobacteriaceae bacterium]